MFFKTLMDFISRILNSIFQMFQHTKTKKQEEEQMEMPKQGPIPEIPEIEPIPEITPIKKIPKFAVNLPDNYFRYILNSEGGYVNHPNDIGGETNRGITTGTLVRAKSRGIAPPDVSIRDLTDRTDVVYAIYNEMYYKESFANKMPHPLSFAYLDACVNHGIGGRTAKGTAVGAGMIFQSVLVEQFGSKIDIDGRVGVQTLNAMLDVLKKVSAEELAERYNDRRELYYKRIVENNPSQKVFFKGWMNRLNKVRSICRGGF